MIGRGSVPDLRFRAVKYHGTGRDISWLPRNILVEWNAMKSLDPLLLDVCAEVSRHTALDESLARRIRSWSSGSP